MPTTRDAGLHHVRSQLVGACVELGQLGCGTDTTTVGWQPRSEYVRDETQLQLTTDRAGDGGRSADVACSANQFGMGIADLVLTKPPAVKLVDLMPTRQPMVDHPDCAAQGTSIERLGTERHEAQRYRCAVSAMVHTTRDTLCQ